MWQVMQMTPIILALTFDEVGILLTLKLVSLLTEASGLCALNLLVLAAGRTDLAGRTLAPVAELSLKAADLRRRARVRRAGVHHLLTQSTWSNGHGIQSRKQNKNCHTLPAKP